MSSSTFKIVIRFGEDEHGQSMTVSTEPAIAALADRATEVAERLVQLTGPQTSGTLTLTGHGQTYRLSCKAEGVTFDRSSGGELTELVREGWQAVREAQATAQRILADRATTAEIERLAAQIAQHPELLPTLEEIEIRSGRAVVPAMAALMGPFGQQTFDSMADMLRAVPIPGLEEELRRAMPAAFDLIFFVPSLINSRNEEEQLCGICGQYHSREGRHRRQQEVEVPPLVVEILRPRLIEAVRGALNEEIQRQTDALCAAAQRQQQLVTALGRPNLALEVRSVVELERLETQVDALEDQLQRALSGPTETPALEDRGGNDSMAVAVGIDDEQEPATAGARESFAH